MRTVFAVLLLFSSATGIIDVFDIDNEVGQKDHSFISPSSNENQWVSLNLFSFSWEISRIIREDVPEQFQNNKNSHNLNTSDILVSL